jgi:hypothetical protein
MAMPRASSDGETPADPIEQGDFQPVRQMLITALLGDFG